MLKGYKSIIFFSAVSLSGLLAVFNAQMLESMIMPIVCHVDPGTMTDMLSTEVQACVSNVVQISGGIMVAVGVVGKLLRFITNSGVFKPE